MFEDYKSKDVVTLEDLFKLFNSGHRPVTINRSFRNYEKNGLIDYFKRCSELKLLIDEGLTKLDIMHYLIRSEVPKHYYCPVCGKEIHANTSCGMNVTCSASCGMKNYLRNGGIHYVNTPEAKEHLRNNSLIKFGTDHPLKSSVALENRKKSVFKKYGVEFPLQFITFQEKSRDTIEIKYGNRVMFKTDHFKELAKITWTENYGVDNPLKSPIIIKKGETTNLSKFGNTNYNKSEIGRKRSSETCQFGSEQRYDDSYKSLFNMKWAEPAFSRDGWEGHRTGKIYKWRCKFCGEIFEDITNSSSYYPRCPKCVIPYRSLIENEVYYWINSLNLNCISKTRKLIYPYELDIYLPDQSLAIEINGNYWHGIDKIDDENYHLNKTILCSEKGITLLQFWESEINEGFDKIKELVLNIFNKEFDKIYSNLSGKYVKLDRSKYINLEYLESIGYKVVKILPPRLVYHGLYLGYNCGYYILKKFD